MSPLSPTKRTLYFTFFTAVFVLCIPFIILYATGYHFTDGFDLARRGGIYVSVPQSGAVISIDEKPHATTTFFNRDYLRQDMTPGTHRILVRHPEYLEWYKEVVVESQHVTPVHPFLIPEDYVLHPVAPDESAATSTQATTGTSQTRNSSAYREVERIFAPAPTSTASRGARGEPRLPAVEKTATLTPATATPDMISAPHKITNSDATLWYTDYGVYVYRTSKDGWLPRRFCNPYTCSNPMEVVRVSEPIRNVDFYPGRDDVILYTQPDGLYAAEVDKRPYQLKERIINGGDIDFRVRHGTLYIKRGDYIAEVEID